MGLSEDLMRSLTLADIEAIASRFAAAVASIREAQSLLGGSPTAPALAVAPRPQPAPRVFSDAEVAERNRLLSRIRGEEYPAAIASAEGDE